MKSPVQYWFILRHAKVFLHRRMARCHTCLKAWLKFGVIKFKGLIKSGGQVIMFLSEK